ncbi:MAG: hypothetical protein HYW90_04715 [Candidatus Sungbacteria bacterium]|nr:hypothetical protein [Candidatus Sungbacteria bacterium]
MIFQTWGDVVVASLQQAWSAVVSFVPFLLSALIVFVIGWIIAVALGKLVEQVIKALRVDMFLAKLDFEKAMERAGMRLNTGAFVGGLVRWFLIIVALLAAANILQLTQVTDFLTSVLLYLPNVVVAVLILVIAALVAEVAERVVRGSVEAAGLRRGSLVGLVARWSVWVFAIVAALLQLGVATVLLQTVVTGLVAMLALAFGLAFGLGGKDAAGAVVDRVIREVRGS